jgi:predicted SprT family Zn-dependent metalloprotease
MDLDQISFNLKAYKEHNQILDAANFVVHQFGWRIKILKVWFREEIELNSILLTTEGEFGEAQRIIIPRNLFDFDLALVMNVIAHEMVHVSQRAAKDFVEDKNEREWQAYYEMLFHKRFPQLPELSDFHKKFFADKAYIYYGRMGEGSELQQKYADEKAEVDAYIKALTEQKN